MGGYLIRMDPLPNQGSATSAPEAPGHDFAPLRSPLLRGLYIAGGTLSLGLGLVGIVVPLVPTTPFLLLSAALFARSSKRLYVWLLTHRWFGPPIRQWRTHRTVSRKAKWTGITLIVLTMPPSIIWVMPYPAGQALLTLIGTSVVVWLYRLPEGRALPRVENGVEGTRHLS